MDKSVAQSFKVSYSNAKVATQMAKYDMFGFPQVKTCKNYDLMGPGAHDSNKWQSIQNQVA